LAGTTRSSSRLLANEKLVRPKAKQPQVVVSLFTRKGKALFVAMNDSDADAQVEMAPDWQALGVAAPAQLIDAYAEQNGRVQEHTMVVGPDGQLKQPEAKAKPDDTSACNVPLKAGVAAFTVKARNFRVLEAR